MQLSSQTRSAARMGEHRHTLNRATRFINHCCVIYFISVFPNLPTLASWCSLCSLCQAFTVSWYSRGYKNLPTGLSTVLPFHKVTKKCADANVKGWKQSTHRHAGEQGQQDRGDCQRSRLAVGAPQDNLSLSNINHKMLRRTRILKQATGLDIASFGFKI